MLNTETKVTPVGLIARIRKRCEDDFEFFVRYFFKHRKGTKFVFEDFHHILCQDLMAVHRGEIEGYIVNIPPRYSKTEVVIIMFSAWCYVKNPRCEFIHLSYAHPLALENSSAIRDIIKSKEFKQLWPHLETRDNKDAKGAWALDEGGQFYATQTGGPVTGFGAGRLDEWNPDTGEFVFSGALSIDDPLKPDDARHDNIREPINKRWLGTIKSRRNSPVTPVICTMQRIHEDDFTAELLRDTDIKWFHRKMSAIVDEGKPGERALWPAKHTLEKLKKMKAANAYVFSAQYGQQPSPPGGGLLKSAEFKRYRVLPRLSYRKIYADTAQKTAERNDYSVLECWGAGVDGNVYLIDVLRGKWEAPELKRKTIDFWNKHKAVADIQTMGQLRQLRVEDKASGTGLIQDIKKEGRIPVFAQQRDKDKVLRVNDVVSYIESGYVYIPEEAPWVSDFTSECDAFTSNDTHAHDDQIDPLIDAIEDMLGGTNIAKLWEQMG